MTYAQLVPGTLPARTVERALTLRLSRPRTSKVPLTFYEVFGPSAQSVPKDLPPQALRIQASESGNQAVSERS